MWISITGCRDGARSPSRLTGSDKKRPVARRIELPRNGRPPSGGSAHAARIARSAIVAVAWTCSVRSDSARAVELLDQQQNNTGTVLTIPTGNSQRWAQTFTVGREGTLTRIRMFLRGTNAAGVIDIRETFTGTPDHSPAGVWLETTFSLNSANGAWVSIPFNGSTLEVQPGEVYAITLRPTAGTNFAWHGADTNPYVTGRAWIQPSPYWLNLPFTTWVTTNRDFAFETYVTPCVSNADCNDGVACTTDVCGASGCTNTANNALCSDGQFCNGVETCNATTGCQPGTPVNCADAVSCTTDTCNEVIDQCVHTPNNSLCSDGQFCNGSETCSATAGCQAGTPVNCADSIPCTSDSCNEVTDQCVHTPNQALCNDNVACTTDTCTATGCTNLPNHAACNDGIACSTDTCTTGGCTHVGNHALCDDGQFCNGEEMCGASGCFGPTTGLVNGTFQGTAGVGWTTNSPQNGFVVFSGAELNVTGADGPPGPATTWVGQTAALFTGLLEFELWDYMSSDTGDWDFPVLVLGNQARGLNHDGTLGPAFALNTNGTSGTINNASPALMVPVRFRIPVGTGLQVVGFGVHTRDGAAGAGFATFDNVYPSGPDPCFGGACNEAQDACPGCTSNAQCDDQDICTLDLCEMGVCANVSRTRCDTNRDGFLNTDDILCLLDTFGGRPDSPACGGQPMALRDPAPCTATSVGDGFINALDILHCQNRFTGFPNPGCNCP